MITFKNQETNKGSRNQQAQVKPRLQRGWGTPSILYHLRVDNRKYKGKTDSTLLGNDWNHLQRDVIRCHIDPARQYEPANLYSEL